MYNKRIVFLGTPKFAATILQGLIDNKYNVVGVVSQPDKLVGKKKQLTITPVKQVALENNIEVYQPVKLKEDYNFLIDLKPDLLITCAYGQILPQSVLDIATINNINVHASLLPTLRGGAPIHRAIINGDTKTGVTIMQMIDKMDAGVMYSKKEVEIDIDINTTQLFDKLQYVGRDLLIETLPSIIDKSNPGIPQDESEVTYAFNIKREEEKLEFNKSALEVHNLIRGLSEAPGAYCYLNDKSFKIYKSKISNIKNDNEDIGMLKVINKKLYVSCKDYYLELLNIQIEGKKAMDSVSFLNGNKNVDGLKLK